MKNARRNSLPQLAALLVGFIATALLLESEALVSWADRLDVGANRTRAIRITSAIHQHIEPLRTNAIRRETLNGLDRIGWTDDPARLQLAHLRLAGNETSGSACSTNLAKSVTPVAISPIRGASAPVATGVPLKTPLAPLPAMNDGKPRVVALAGDSMMAVGLSNVLLRAAANNPNVRVIHAFKSGTGLARPDVFDWMQEYPAMIGSEHPDAVIVAIGANDGQGFIENGKTLAFGSDAWIRAYQQRTAAFLDMLTRDGAHVVWVGLPPMRSGQYDARIVQINRIAYSVVSQYPQATWWNPQPLIADESGRYLEFGVTPDGKTKRLRESDGIHLSDEGASLLTPSLMNWLNAQPPSQTAHFEKAVAPKAL